MEDITAEEFGVLLRKMLAGKLDYSPITNDFLLEGMAVHAEEMERRGDQIAAKLVAEMLVRFKKLQAENAELKRALPVTQ